MIGQIDSRVPGKYICLSTLYDYGIDGWVNGWEVENLGSTGMYLRMLVFQVVFM